MLEFSVLWFLSFMCQSKILLVTESCCKLPYLVHRLFLQDHLAHCSVGIGSPGKTSLPLVSNAKRKTSSRANVDVKQRLAMLTFSVEGQIGNTSGFAAHKSLSQLLSSASLQSKVSLDDNMNECVWPCSSTALFTKTGNEPDVACGPKCSNP